MHFIPILLFQLLLGVTASFDKVIGEDKEPKITSTDGKFSFIPPRRWNKPLTSKQSNSIILARESTSLLHGVGILKAGRYRFPQDIVLVDIAKAVRENDQQKLLDYKFIGEEEMTISQRKSISYSYSYRVAANDVVKFSCSSFMIPIDKREMIILTFSITEPQYPKFQEAFQKSALSVEIKE